MDKIKKSGSIFDSCDCAGFDKRVPFDIRWRKYAAIAQGKDAEALSNEKAEIIKDYQWFHRFIAKCISMENSHTSFNEMRPEVFFALYDVPLLTYLYTLHKQEPRLLRLRYVDCPECFQPIFSSPSRQNMNNG